MLSLKTYNQVLKNYDSRLYAQNSKENRIDVYRRAQFSTHLPHFLFSLTDSWQPQGVPVPYGTEVLLNRLRAMDLWRDDGFVESWIKEHENEAEQKQKAFKSSTEDFFYEFHSKFKKDFSDINTANLKKSYRKENHNGYCEPRS